MADAYRKPTDKRFKDLEGLIVNNLKVISYEGSRNRQSRWRCACSCGREIVVASAYLTSGTRQSCGCVRNANVKHANTRHGSSRTREYNCWSHMIRRCTRPHEKAYQYYGGRGISVCDRWLESVNNFIADMGPCPSEKHSLDRIDNNGNYEPSNCRWATRDEQNRNKRSNVWITLNGVRKCLTDWAQHYGVSKTRVRERMLHGWSAEEALGIIQRRT